MPTGDASPDAPASPTENYIVIHNAALNTFMDEVNDRIGKGYVPYGGMARVDGEYAQVMVTYTDKIQGRSAALVWQYFSDSGAMLNVAVDPVQDLMDTAAVNILEEFKP